MLADPSPTTEKPPKAAAFPPADAETIPNPKPQHSLKKPQHIISKTNILTEISRQLRFLNVPHFKSVFHTQTAYENCHFTVRVIGQFKV